MRAATGFVARPEPRGMGRFAGGKQLLAGNFLFAGYHVEAPGVSVWDVESPSPEFEAALQAFDWLDDLAAVGDGPARMRAQAWLGDWIARYGSGRGPGWTPEIAGRRLIRWVHHGLFLLAGQEQAEAEAFFAVLAQQTHFLARRWLAASSGLPRFEALTGLLYAGLSLRGMEEHVGPAVAGLSRECDACIDAEGGLESRNPEELLEVFTLLTWADTALREAGHRPDMPHVAAIERIAPTLRSLRHADGGLARFHGGGRGAEGQLDQALAASGMRAGARGVAAMGYARLAAGRTTVIVDAAQPPSGPASRNAHASTLAFELTSGRRPLIVNCGAGGPFGPEWRRAGRATASHSTLSIEGYSSSRLGRGRRIAGGDEEILAERPAEVTVGRDEVPQGAGLLLSHDGYARTHGLVHVRRLDLSQDGRALMGEDSLATMTPAQRRQFDRALDHTGLEGVPVALRFHLHPDIDATLDMGGKAVSILLRSGEVWIFRAEGVPLALAPSVYLERGRLRPRPAQQIVLSLLQRQPASQFIWTLSKAQDSPVGIRDFATDDDEDRAVSPEGE
ncbi:heparinase II/III family protein [Alkalilacustris brevis]|uniref:heparinase II/III family protein n=1 Tax=Alkalilacustris brevis TaxID=2026338 RepID=UPI001EE3F6F1|nr:heparinase II/III family protein [Alkalilacustris brevis]